MPQSVMADIVGYFLKGNNEIPSFFSLIQAQLGCIPIQDFALTQDTAKIFRNGSRITRCMFSINGFFIFFSKLEYYI